MLSRLSTLAGALLVVFALSGTFCAYFVSRPLDNGQWVDGLGRPQVPSPGVVRFACAQGEHWPGWRWAAIDFVSFWSLVGVGGLLIGRGTRAKE